MTTRAAESRPGSDGDSSGGLWVEQTAHGNVRVGLEEGSLEEGALITRIELSQAGAQVERQSEFVSLHLSNKVCTAEDCTYISSVRRFIMPRRFEIEQINSDVVSDPALIQEDPCGRGWLVEGRFVD